MYSRKGKLLKSYKTTVRKNENNPQFNEISVFPVHPSDLNKIFLKVTIYQFIEGVELEIGKIIVSRNKDKLENSHWSQMIIKVRSQAMMWYSLE